MTLNATTMPFFVLAKFEIIWFMALGSYLTNYRLTPITYRSNKSTAIQSLRGFASYAISM